MSSGLRRDAHPIVNDPYSLNPSKRVLLENDLNLCGIRI
jgi:hypothetical protein